MDNSKSIQDIVTVIGPAYFQPIADLISKLVEKNAIQTDSAGSGFRENGYSASSVILIVAMLESFIARLRYCRNEELPPGSKSIPDLLQHMFKDFPYRDKLEEIFLLRNLLIHNHIWELDVSNRSESVPVLRTPHDLKVQTNKHYLFVVDQQTRKTRLLGLNANPCSAGREDVLKVLIVVLDTLGFMNKIDFSVCPLSNDEIVINGKRMKFNGLIEHLQKTLYKLNPADPLQRWLSFSWIVE